MKKLWSRKKSIPAIRLVPASHRPWLDRAALGLIAGGVLAIFFFSTYHSAGSASGNTPSKEQITQLKQQVKQLSNEREQLSDTSNSAESKLNIELSTQKQLADQVKVLTQENNKLKEDLAFFENLIPSSQAQEGVRIGGFKANAGSHSQLQYRVLVMQGGKGVRDFVGELQLVATVVQAGKNVTITYPDAKEGETGKLKLSFRYYQRIEGTLTLPEGSSIKTLQARIMDKGRIRTFQSVNL